MHGSKPNIPYFLTVKFVCWVYLRLWHRLEVRGGEHIPARGPFIIAANHVSYLDPVVIGVAAPRIVSFMAKADLHRFRLLSWFLRNMGVIPLQREEADMRAMREAIRRLRAGQPMGIFPEGERQPSGEITEAKRGIGVLAAMSGVPVIPALIHGTYEALPRGSRRLRRVKIRVAFSSQITYTESRFSVDPPGRKAGLAARHAALAVAVTQSWRRLQSEFN